MVQAVGGGGCGLWGTFSWRILEPLVCLNATAYLGIVSDHVPKYMTLLHLAGH